jgi:hypothetical protein
VTTRYVSKIDAFVWLVHRYGASGLLGRCMCKFSAWVG